MISHGKMKRETEILWTNRHVLRSIETGGTCLDRNSLHSNRNLVESYINAEFRSAIYSVFTGPL